MEGSLHRDSQGGSSVQEAGGRRGGGGYIKRGAAQHAAFTEIGRLSRRPLQKTKQVRNNRQNREEPPDVHEPMCFQVARLNLRILAAPAMGPLGATTRALHFFSPARPPSASAP
jgi:hypothetical protein